MQWMVVLKECLLKISIKAWTSITDTPKTRTINSNKLVYRLFADGNTNGVNDAPTSVRRHNQQHRRLPKNG
jgi:hypothetical protein